MDTLTQLKKLAPFLDPHLLLFLLQANIGSESQALQDQIKSKLVSADPAKAKLLLQESEEKAKKLVTLLSDSNAVTRMRKDGQFNFDQLNKGASKVSIGDCQDLFDHAKLLFECQKYESKSPVCCPLTQGTCCRRTSLPVHSEGDPGHASRSPLPTGVAGLLGLACLRDPAPEVA